MIAFLFLAVTPPPPRPDPDPPAIAVVERAIARMGGETALRRITRARFDLMTQWQRISFDDRPNPDILSFEQHTDLRDYSIPAWRNTRRFAQGGSWREITDIVRDSVGIRAIDGAWTPLNVAYLDERREVFAFTPERLLLEARDAADLRSLPDTTIAGVPHARVAATIDRFPATLFLRRADELLAMARFKAAQPNDFGLAPWGTMEVEWGYSRWQKTSTGIAIPMQWDIRRVGRPYKRMTVLAAKFDSVAVTDSFAVSDSLRHAFLTTAIHPMHDLPLDSARLIEPGLASFATNGYPVGAVRVGKEWLLLEMGQAPMNAERAAQWLERAAPGSQVIGGIVTAAAPGGGAAWLVRQRKRLYVAPLARPATAAVLRNNDAPIVIEPVTSGRWLRSGTDSLWVEPIDFPDALGSALVYSPSLRWAFAAVAAAPLQTEYLVDRLRRRGWDVSRVGSFRNIAVPLPPKPATSP